jgi:Ni,Fe-hydrogenase III small subunit
VSAVQLRLVVAVGAAVSYSSAVHTRAVPHWRSVVAVGAAVSNSRGLEMHSLCGPIKSTSCSATWVPGVLPSSAEARNNSR